MSEDKGKCAIPYEAMRHAHCGIDPLQGVHTDMKKFLYEHSDAPVSVAEDSGEYVLDNNYIWHREDPGNDTVVISWKRIDRMSPAESQLADDDKNQGSCDVPNSILAELPLGWLPSESQLAVEAQLLKYLFENSDAPVKKSTILGKPYVRDESKYVWSRYDNPAKDAVTISWKHVDLYPSLLPPDIEGPPSVKWTWDEAQDRMSRHGGSIDKSENQGPEIFINKLKTIEAAKSAAVEIKAKWLRNNISQHDLPKHDDFVPELPEHIQQTSKNLSDSRKTGLLSDQAAPFYILDDPLKHNDPFNGDSKLADLYRNAAEKIRELGGAGSSVESINKSLQEASRAFGAASSSDRMAESLANIIRMTSGQLEITADDIIAKPISSMITEETSQNTTLPSGEDLVPIARDDLFGPALKWALIRSVLVFGREQDKFPDVQKILNDPEISATLVITLIKEHGMKIYQHQLDGLWYAACNDYPEGQVMLSENSLEEVVAKAVIEKVLLRNKEFDVYIPQELYPDD